MPTDQELIDELCKFCETLITYSREALPYLDKDLAAAIKETADMATDFIVNFCGEE